MKHNPEGDTLLLIAAAGAAWWWWHNRATAAPAPPGPTTAPQAPPAAPGPVLDLAAIAAMPAPPAGASVELQQAWVQLTRGYQVWARDEQGNLIRPWVRPGQITNPEICQSAYCPPGAKLYGGGIA